MKFYCITENTGEYGKVRSALLEKACVKKGIDFIPLVAEGFNCIESSTAFEKKSILYRAESGAFSRLLEQHLLTRESVTFYSNFEHVLHNPSISFFYNQKAKLPVIKSLPYITNNKEQLIGYSDYLGGFPMIVKVMGNSHGVGVIKVDTIDALVSLTDYLSEQNVVVLLRQFIPHQKQARLIVIGNRVIASHVNYSTIDFRTNVGDNSVRKREPFVFSDVIQDIAVKAVRSTGVEFGGVDILFDEKTDEPFISEVNFPCHFPTTQYITGIDIGLAMVECLIDKSKKLT